jgi:hypothetical protein
MRISRKRLNLVLLAVLGAVSGTAGFALMIYLRRLGFARYAHGGATMLLQALALNSLPGTMFGIVIGGFLFWRDGLRPLGWPKYVAESALAYVVAFVGAGFVFLLPDAFFRGQGFVDSFGSLSLVLLLLFLPFGLDLRRRCGRGEFTGAPARTWLAAFLAGVLMAGALAVLFRDWNALYLSWVGSVGGFLNSYLLGAAAARLVRTTPRRFAMTPVTVGTAAGTLLPVAVLPAYYILPLPFMLFHALWQAAYAASLVCLLRLDSTEAQTAAS